MHDLSSLIPNHMDVVFFIYGLAFFALGLVILVQPKEESQYESSRFVGWLAFFGLVHGAMEWLDLWKIGHGDSSTLALLKVDFLLVSYFFLFEFGRRLTQSICDKIPAVPNIVGKMLGTPIYGIVALGFMFELLMIPDRVLAITIASRYFLGFVGSSLAGIGFLLCVHKKLPQQVEKTAHSWARKYYVIAAMSFIFYGVLAGLVVPPANIIPANVINDQWFLATFKFPVQIFRAICAVLAAIAVGNILRVFHLEIREKLLSSLKLAKESEAKVREITSVLAEGVYAFDCDGLVTFVNPEMEKLLGWTATELLGKKGHETFHYKRPDGTPVSVESCLVHQTLLTGQTYRSSDEWLVRKDGSIIPVSIVSSPIFMDGKVMGSVAAFHDITERKKAEADLHIAATAFEAQEGMVVTDDNGVILRVNSAFTQITGYTAEEAVGQNPRILKSDRHDENFYAAMWKNLNDTGVWEGEIWNRRKNGEIYPELLIITAVKDQNGILTNYVATFNDITEIKAAEEEINNLAFFDPLTRLPNRRLLIDRLQQALASSARNGREGALLFIDLDNFKTLNDTLGHDIGDQLLQQVARRLESCVREGDTVARLGGDDFVVMLEDLSEQAFEAAAQTEAVGDKILSTLNQSYQLATHEYHCSTSIGVVLFNDHEQEIDELMKQADIAMYQAKKAGRNTLRFFDPQMQNAVNIRADLEGELHKALENQQFHLYYQIQVDSSHRPLGAEALIRWIHPERGLVSPAQFIPLAEETGLILPIGQWVLETACAQIKAWQQSEFTCDFILAVNVSAQQFRQADFVSIVQATVQRHAINPKLLKLELTESLLLEKIEDTIATMNTLKEIGIEFSLDDFGTGYSSLQYLKLLPLRQLKIDQSFVRDIAIDSSDRAIVRTIIAMANSLNIGVIAEGVETEEQRQLLLNEGCVHYQGYLFGKPIPIEQFEKLLLSNKLNVA